MTAALALPLAVLHVQCPDRNFSSSCSPLIFFYSKDRAATATGAAGLAGGHHREAWTSKGPSYEDLYTQNVVINMDDQDDVHRTSLEGKSAKERPIWLRESTVQGAYSSEDMKEGKSEKSVRWVCPGLVELNWLGRPLAFTLGQVKGCDFIPCYSSYHTWSSWHYPTHSYPVLEGTPFVLKFRN